MIKFESGYIGTKRNDFDFQIKKLQYSSNSLRSESQCRGLSRKYAIVWMECNKDSVKERSAHHYIGSSLIVCEAIELSRLSIPELTNGFVISFTSSFYDFTNQESVANGTYQLLRQPAPIKLGDDAFNDTKFVVDMMFREFSARTNQRSETLKHYLSIFLMYVSSYIEPTRNGLLEAEGGLIRKFRVLLDENFKTLKMVANYADLLAITPNYLNEAVKKSTGHSAGYHIRQRVAAEAKRLAQPKSCLKEIAYDLGFLDLAHFSKFFRNTTGLSFSDYRRTLSNTE